MSLVKPQRNTHLRIRFQIERMKLKFWWKHFIHLISLPCTKH